MIKINRNKINRSLIIKEPWLSLILSRQKYWEMRTSLARAKIYGWIGLIRQGNVGQIVGITRLVDAIGPLTEQELVRHKDKHCIDYELNPEFYKWRYAWIFADSQKIEPVSYSHKQGSVIWVKHCK